MSEILSNTGVKLWAETDYSELWLTVFDQLTGQGGKSNIRLIDEAIGKINDTLDGYKFEFSSDEDRLYISKGDSKLPVSLIDSNGHVASKVDGTTITIDESGVVKGIPVDDALSEISTNPLQNKVIAGELKSIKSKIGTDESTIKSNTKRIEANETAISTLNGTGDGSVKKAVSDGIAEVVAGAPEDFDTLKEMSDWISTHETSASAMNSQIQDNKKAIDNHASNGDIHVTPENKTNWNKVSEKLDKTGDASNVTTGFTTATTRSNLTTKEKLSTSLGKIAKWFSDLKTVAFSGSYNDLSDKPIVDANISLTSTNPVQNKVVTQNLIDIRKETTVNLLKPTLRTVTENGVTCTNNGDGTYTLNGTATKDVVLYIAGSPTKNAVGGYKLLGCPINGSKDTYRIVVSYYDNESWKAEGSDIGNGVIIDDTYSKINYFIKVKSGTTVTNLVFKPMITTNLSATYDDFVPYTGDTGKLNGDVAALKAYVDEKASESVDLSVSASKSLNDTVEAPLVLNKTTKNLLNPTAQSITQGGITCTNNGDGTYTLNGTATSEVICVFLRDEEGKSLYKNIVGKTLKFLNGGSIKPPVGRFLFTLRDGNKLWHKGEHYDNSIFTVSEGYSQVTIDLHIYKNQTLTNVIVKPMLTTDLEATVEDFVPYSGYDIRSCGKNVVGNPSNFNSPTVKDGVITFPAKSAATGDAYLRLYSDVDISAFGTFRAVVESIGETINDPNKSYVIIKTKGKKEFSTLSATSFESSANKYVSNVFNCSDFGNKIAEIMVVIRKGYAYLGGSYKISIFNGEDKEFSNWVKYVESSVHIDPSTEFPLLGLKSFDGETNIISPANTEVLYAKSEIGAALLGTSENKPDDSMSDTSTHPVQNKVIKQYTDGTFRKKKIAELNGDGKTQYFKLCTIKVKTTYADTPFEITVRARGHKMLDRLCVLFTSVNNLDPELASFKVFGQNGGWYITKVSASTWAIYGAKSEPWAAIQVVNHTAYNGVEVTWDMTGVESLPSSKTQVQWGGNVLYAQTAGNVVNNHTTTVEGFSLDARQANPNVSGSLGAQIKAINDMLNTKKIPSFAIENIFTGNPFCVVINTSDLASFSGTKWEPDNGGYHVEGIKYPAGGQVNVTVNFTLTAHSIVIIDVNTLNGEKINVQGSCISYNFTDSPKNYNISIQFAGRNSDTTLSTIRYMPLVIHLA